MISIADLPDDILIAIFHRCTAPTEDIHFSSLDATSPSWILACVSRSWRAITITTPLLWAKIRLPLFRYLPNSHWDHNPSAAKIVARTQRLLQLTQKCTLDIVIIVRRHRALSMWNELMPIICATAPRWQRFTSDASDALFAALQVETFPYLEHLGLDVSEMYARSSAADKASKRIDCFQNAHALHSLSLNAIEDCTFVLELAIPWQNLTAYSTNMGRMLNNSLHLLSCVEELHAKLEEEEGAEDDTLTAAPDAVQVLPRLTTLDLDLSDGHTHDGALQPYVRTILRRLHAPSLTKLRLRICGFQFISKPLLLHCNLDNLLDLSIHDESPILSTDIPDFWRLTTPNVEVLHLSVGRTEVFFNAMLCQLLAFPPVPVPLPRLKVLSLHAPNLSFGSPYTIARIALQRRGALDKKLWMPLEEVRVWGESSEFGCGVTAAAVERLNKEYERQKRSLSSYEDEELAPLHIHAVQSDF
ncbi:hypothetical protein CYLTODRAFT_422899, partial [Cylindrobasidium torrendii FP15055 ss-10]